MKPLGRSTPENPKNRFETERFEPDIPAPDRIPTEYHLDATRSALSKNTSKDIPFTFGINPYRGCEHGCIYCYARPTHEYLGFSAGLDFESNIVVKHDLPELLEKTLRKKSWVPQTIALSGNTDCYQPAERRFRLTRKCLKVLLKHRNPVSIITKSHLIEQDLELLGEMAALNLVHVTISVTTLDSRLAGLMEPRASSPTKRLECVKKLCGASIPVGLNLAPVIPGLNDNEIDRILKRGAENGAQWASYILLRLPGAVEPLFLDWLDSILPNYKKKVTGTLALFRGGALSDGRIGTRMHGTGHAADLLNRFFRMSHKRHGYGNPPALCTKGFRIPEPSQLSLF